MEGTLSRYKVGVGRFAHGRRSWFVTVLNSWANQVAVQW
jgi:hypothetical protein